MLLHQIDPSYKRLSACWKRANTFAADGEINKTHSMFIVYSNFCFFMDALISLEDYQDQLFLLDWFALKIDDYAKINLLKNDDSIAAMLYSWQSKMFLDPTKLSH